ncbi:MAG: c-type cytochrome [Verrucomicrobiales bacterium]|nr:c-type cytochrome [Verrucomicrobiales bacterium]
MRYFRCLKFAILGISISISLLVHAQEKGKSKPDPKSLKFTKWTPDFEVPNPVGISFDDKTGAAYVSATERRKANDLDIRNNRDWIPKDLSFTSSEEKRAFYHEQFTVENSEKNRNRVKDYNDDGVHDLKDLQALSDRIYKIEDADDDGLADTRSIYAEGFTDEIAGIAAGVLFHESDVYTTIVPDVFKMRDTDGDGKSDTRKSIAHGFGVHLAYAGHDMHGLTVGPDGRIYWTIGDKGLNVTSKEGLNFKFPNHGAVLRCVPDGSNFEVFARGLRNVQELAFDQYGNLFGIDNDSDNEGEKERFVYIVRHMDAGWRSNWQYRRPDYNPWMAENMSVPFRPENQPGHIVPPIRLYENGPAGLVFNPGTALGPEWENYFFHTSAPNGQQWAFQVQQKGASFEMVNDMQIGNGIPIVGINFGPDGALYGVDWGGGYPLNEKGAVWKWDVEEKNPKIRDTTEKFLAEDFSEIETSLLDDYLLLPDQRVRLKAQFELVKRGELEAFEKLTRIPLDAKQWQFREWGRRGVIHAIWGIGQINRNSDQPNFRSLIDLLEHDEAEIRTQAVKTIGEQFGAHLAVHEVSYPKQQGLFDERTLLTRKIIPLLKDDSDRVKFHAALALGNLGIEEAAQPILEMIDALDDVNFPYLRHAAAVGLTGCASTDFLVGVYDEDFELEHQVAVDALRRRADPAVGKFLNALTSGVCEDAARAIHDDWTIPEAMPELAAALETTKLVRSEPFIRRATNANLMLGKAENAGRVAAFAVKTDVPEILRLDALDALAKWTEPPVLDRVVGRHREHDPRDPEIARDALRPRLGDLLTDQNTKIQTGAMALARNLKIDIDPNVLVAVGKNPQALPALRIEAMRGLAAQKKPAELSEVLGQIWNTPQPEVRVAALEVTAAEFPEEALEKIRVILESKVAAFSEKQAAFRLLADSPVASESGDAILKNYVDDIKNVPAEIQLDLAEAAIARKIEGAPEPDFSHTLAGGDAKAGEDIFMNHIAAQCIRCHKVQDGKGSNIGPNLKWIGRKKDRAYILESLVNPGAVIASGYGTISLTLKNGDSVAGQFRSEKDGVIEIRDPEGKITKVKSDDVKERTPVITTMPPAGLILQKREVRDVIEYLASLQAPEKKK